MTEDTQRQVEKMRDTPGLSESEVQTKIEELERQCVSEFSYFSYFDPNALFCIIYFYFCSGK